MIEKLKVVLKPEDWNLPVNELEMRCLKNLLLKIDELVDAVNNLQKDYDNVCIWVGEQKLNYNPDTTKGLSTLVEEPEPADPFAEQRKWIGCLCRFWFDNKKMADLGILGDIDDMNSVNPYFNADLGHDYRNCEPVSPDDDIIYKKD